VAVRTQASLDEALVALSLDESDPRAMAFASGELKTAGVLRDADFGVQSTGLELSRTVEVYQWQERKTEHKRKVPDGRGGQMTETTTTYDYSLQWLGTEQPSARFSRPHGHENPSWGDAIAEASRATGAHFEARGWEQPASLNGLSLSPALLSQAKSTTPLSPDANRLRAAVPLGVLSGNHLLSAGCGRNLRAGCVRISWSHVPAQFIVSVLAREARGSLVPWPSSAGPGYEVAILSRGSHDPLAMLSRAQAEAAVWTWVKRGLGSLLVWAGYGLLFGPAHFLASYVPFLSGLVGCLLSLVALCVAAAHALTVIALAWLAQRPLLAATLLAAAAGLLYLLGARLLKGRNKHP